MLRLTSIDLKKAKIDTLAVAVCEDKDIHDDPLIEAVVKKALALKEFNGKKDETVTLYDVPDIKARRVILRGLGKLEKIDREALRSMAGKTVKSCIEKETDGSVVRCARSFENTNGDIDSFRSHAGRRLSRQSPVSGIQGRRKEKIARSDSFPGNGTSHRNNAPIIFKASRHL